MFRGFGLFNISLLCFMFYFIFLIYLFIFFQKAENNRFKKKASQPKFRNIIFFVFA